MPDPGLALLASLRIGPALLGPPFSQLRVPLPVRVCLVLALALLLTGRQGVPHLAGSFAAAAVCELVLGLAIAMGLHTAYASLQYAGRVIDVQAGYGMAMVIDPSSRNQVPLFGSILTWVAGAVFMAHDAHLELIRVIANLGGAMPIGQAHLAAEPVVLIGFFSLSMGLGLSLIGGILLILLLIDLAIAFLSRTLPQMNALMLGFQVKALVTLLTLAICAPFAAVTILRLIGTAMGYITALARA